VRITRVELENIKSYRHAVIPLLPGTTAVRGHNGAGKSTLVEAIGFALFDAIQYNQAQFVREGEKSGTVTVSFISALDDREYQVVRRAGSSSAWYVYDPELDARPAEQKVDVTDFLRKHLRIETDLTLSDLFNDAIGVPQGTFTADFLLSPAQRKKKFDTLLQVEDYRKAAEKLADTRTYLQDEKRAIQRRIDDLQRETDQLDDWRELQTAYRQQERALAGRLAAIQKEAAEAEARREELRQREAEVQRRGAEVPVAEAAWTAARMRLDDARERVAEAREAVGICQRTRPLHQAHLAAQAGLDAARGRMRVRDGLRQRQAEANQRAEGAAADLRHVREQLTQAQAAERRLAELAPAVAQQGELERARDAARQDCQRLDEVRRAIAKAEREHAQVTADIAGSERRIAALEAQRPLAALLGERQERLAMLQDIRAKRSERERQLRKVVEELAKERTAHRKAVQAEAKAAANVEKLLAHLPVAEQVPALEAQFAQVQQEVQRLEAQLEHHRFSREASGAGQCPFLREPCLNIRQRGENNLASYFDRLIQKAEEDLAPVREQRDHLEAELNHAREVHSYVARLDEYRERHAQEREKLAEVEERIARLEAEQHDGEEFLRDAPGEAAIAEAQQLFHESDEADKRLRELAPRQAELKRLIQRRDALAAELAAGRARADELAGAPDALRLAEAELVALGDPRQEMASVQGLARERARLETAQAQGEQRVAALRAELDALEVELLPFAELDAEVRELDDERKRTQEGHAQYLRYEQVAGRLAEREAAEALAEQEARAAGEAHARAVADYESVRAGFDPEELASVSRRVEELSGERGRVTAQLSQTQADGARLAAEIARVEALAVELRAAHEEYAAADDIEHMLQQFRDTIKEAGPSIMKALLRQISVEANRIFGEIMGDRSAELSWESDYEVVLRRDGKDRSFAQLSGGEQMSAALAVRLALLRSLTRLDLAFFDEPTQNMDDERRGNLAEQIRRVRGFDQLIVISHDDTFEQGLDCVIHLIKRNGETIVDEDLAPVLTETVPLLA
jgi:exonuclease SbcC